MGGQPNEVRRQRRVVVAVVLIVMFASLAACTPLAVAATSPSPTGTQSAIADSGGGSFQVTWVLVVVAAFIGAGWVVWLKRRGGGGKDDR
jgi:hypothetical protein